MTEIKGIDVSKWQGKIDWDAVKADGVQFAILRAGFGGDLESQDDVYFERNVSECVRLGIPYGVYIYSYADRVEDSVSEANHMIRLLKGKKPEWPVFYDLEDANTTGKCSNATILEIAKTFTEKLEAAGYVVGIYANKYWNTTKLTDKWYDTKPRWIAQYNSKCTYNGKYDIWQYSSSGKVNGIKGGVDMNIAYTDLSKKESISTPTPAPAQTQNPEKSIDELAQEVLKGLHGNGDARKASLGDKYQAVQDRVNEIIKSQNTAQKPVQKQYVKGAAITLKNAPLYASSTSKKESSKKTGTYYIYDGQKINGRYRITNKAKNCGKKPASLYVTGYIEL